LSPSSPAAIAERVRCRRSLAASGGQRPRRGSDWASIAATAFSGSSIAVSQSSSESGAAGGAIATRGAAGVPVVAIASGWRLRLPASIVSARVA
jgi:hypothetical protein